MEMRDSKPGAQVQGPAGIKSNIAGHLKHCLEPARSACELLGEPWKHLS